MNTRQMCDQWLDMNRAVIEPIMRWNEIAFQTAERVAGNRQVYDQWFELNRATINPFMRWNEIALRAAERVARCNLTMAQDYLDLGTRQMNLLFGETRDPQKWRDEENRLVSEFSQRMVEHASDYLKVARETQDALNDWANQTARETAERAAGAADTTARAAGEVTRQTAEGAARGAEAAKQAGPAEAAKQAGPQPQKA